MTLGDTPFHVDRSIRIRNVWRALDPVDVARPPESAAGLVDVSLAIVLTGLAELQLVLSWPATTTRWSLLLTALQTLPVAFRRRAPVLVLLLTGLAGTAHIVFRIRDADFGTLGVLVAFYTVTVQAGRRWVVAFAVLAALGLPAAKLLDVGGSILNLSDMLFAYAEFAAAWALGLATRYRQHQIARLEARSRMAAAAERTRIAREMHDVISHSLSVIMVQAGAARRQVATHPESALACLRTVESVGRQTWTEMRGLLRLVREGGPAVAEAGVERLHRLIERLEDAGLAVDLVLEGRVRPLPEPAEQAVYRIVQESLTNTLRHAGPVAARVAIAYGERAIELEVADAGGRPPADLGVGGAPAGGHGLRGLRERVEQAGGSFSAGPDGDGFLVRAHLPLDASPA